MPVIQYAASNNDNLYDHDNVNGTGMKTHEMTRKEYEVIQTKRPGQSGMARYWGQIHQNHVARMAGEGRHIPKRVLSAYPSIREHPAYRSAVAAGGKGLSEKSESKSVKSNNQKMLEGTRGFVQEVNEAVRKSRSE